MILSAETAVVCSLLWLVVQNTSATYLPWNSHERSLLVNDKSNVVRPYAEAAISDSQQTNIRRQKSSFFKDDAEIHRYLKGQGRQLMLWRCRNAIQQLYSHHRPLAFVELFCNVIGTAKTVAWYHNGLQIAGTDVNIPQAASRSANRYWHTVATHHDGGRYYNAWLDFRLRIYNATQSDSGVYWFQTTSHSGEVERHAVFVDIAPVYDPPVTSSSDVQPSAAASKIEGLRSNRKRKRKPKMRKGRKWLRRTSERK